MRTLRVESRNCESNSIDGQLSRILLVLTQAWPWRTHYALIHRGDGYEVKRTRQYKNLVGKILGTKPRTKSVLVTNPRADITCEAGGSGLDVQRPGYTQGDLYLGDRERLQQQMMRHNEFQESGNIVLDNAQTGHSGLRHLGVASHGGFTNYGSRSEEGPIVVQGFPYLAHAYHGQPHGLTGSHHVVVGPHYIDGVIQ
eukprot:Blabericola_migrator_1__7791@NODE_3989_length_1396_cov_14_662152_g2459_i0_p2_GENE_NODE_3989_length_1396_cov_14_662152_g2459_i0NODE_3989_length_1396_cov_14_662152_g2459_i0_p2_ORF_typecomplete_len198_score14_95_NODE_3989_length_1396_cov_14_662152_g2459_i07741367